MSSSAVVHLIDDDDDVRSSLSFLLGSAGFAVRSHSSAIAFLEALPTLQAGCIVSDVRMPEMDGLELLRRLKAIAMNFPVIIMTGHADVTLAVEAMKAGAVDFIEKPFDAQVMIAAIQVALAGWADREDEEAKSAQIGDRFKLLSPRERGVFERVAQGKPNKVIAFELSVSPRTVEIHRANAMAKMGARNLSELIRMAMAVGVLSAEPTERLPSTPAQ
ncbi:MAG TPA: response regulator FixJ [Acidisoma sp.]|nr:response regulator FixJ [Acidisoma sp.]